MRTMMLAVLLLSVAVYGQSSKPQRSNSRTATNQSSSGSSSGNSQALSPRGLERITKEVRHELVMLPFLRGL